MWTTEEATKLSISYETLLKQINVSSTDDGFRFTDLSRINQIKAILEADQKYKLRHDGYVSLIYQHQNYNPNEDSVLISSHIDSVHPNHFTSDFDAQTWVGSFDNSSTNAALLTLMTSAALSPQVMIAFTGDEEADGHGADEVVRFFETTPSAGNLDVVICLDVTPEGYKDHGFTIENWFAGVEGRFEPLDEKDIKRMLKKTFPNALMIDEEDGWPDETYTYEEHDVFCFLIGLPVKKHPQYRGDEDEFMESELGILLKKTSVIPYMEAIVKATKMLGC